MRILQMYVRTSCLWIAASSAIAQGPIISSFDYPGLLSWTYPTSGVAAYRVEWSPQATYGKWTDLEQGMRGIVPTGSVMTTTVPMFYRVRAVGPIPSNMVYIPGGAFQMGDSAGGSAADALPVHSVYVSPFFMDRFEVTVSLFQQVFNWSVTNGYVYSGTPHGAASNHPVLSVNWYDAIKWCNARSEREGLQPCYYTDTSKTTVYRSGELDLSNGHVAWEANGYRLPTEAEWEKAARGGAEGFRFPWPDNTITHRRATYFSDASIPFDTSLTRGHHPDFTNATLRTSPVGYHTANGFGLYDMAGNATEWCWDWYGAGYYAASPSADPPGPTTGLARISRGGAYDVITAVGAQVAYRFSLEPFAVGLDFLCGFRTVRR